MNDSNPDELTLEQALERLRTREQELRQLHAALEASKVALWDWNLRTGEVTYSAEWKRQLGCELDEVTTALDEWRSRVHPDDLERMNRIVPAYIEKPWPNYAVEFRMRHKDGSWRWILSHAALAYDDKGRPIRMLGSQIDITEKKQAEQDLAERESQLALFIEHCGVPIAMFDREMRYVAASRRWRKDFRLDGPIQGRSHYEVFPEISDRWRGIHQRCLAGAVEKCEEDRFDRADGSVDWLRWEVRPWFGAEREIGGIVIFSEVITARKQAENSLRESQLRLQAALRAGGIGTWIWDIEKDLVEVDEWILQMVGRTREEFEGATFDHMLTFVLQEDVPFIREAFKHSALTGLEVDHEMRVPRPDGKVVWLSSKGRVERNADGRAVRIIGAVVDITHNRTLEQELLQAQKLDAIGKLAGGVAHDFNNILTVILGQASLAGMRHDLPEPVADSVREITIAAQRAAELSSQLLAFGRRQVMQVREVDLNETVTSAMRMFERLLGRTIQLEFKSDLPRAIVEADPGMLTQVLLNLAVNARDAMPRGGRLTIGTTVVRFDEESATRIVGAMPGAWIRLSISDTGTGISREILPHVFEPFFTTKGVGEGTGLGLSTVYGIVKQHGGWVSIDTDTNRGTTFRVHLPPGEAMQVVPRVEPEAPAAARPKRSGQSILLVEDEPAVRTLVRLSLERFGYTVWAADNGAAARELWNEKAGEIDLLLTDVVMPGGMTGPQLVALLRELKPDLKVILSSGHGADIVGDRFEWRADAVFLQKPYDMQNLVGTVQRMLDQA